MYLEAPLTDITKKSRQGKHPNEHSISQGIVLRVFAVVESRCLITRSVRANGFGQQTDP